MLSRWPHITPFLRLETAGWVADEFHQWQNVEKSLDPQERAAANEEWADFFEWRLGQRAGELARDRVKRHLVTKWTDDMAYWCRRSARLARGEDPGVWVPQRQRRPELDLEGRAIVADMGYGTTGRASSKMAPASSAL
ncbi:hypothetical protein [Actinophytocola sp.]|uniref:hypothetical protein n=1 Tax=Actinophytocola sp. TaxID=1872138 RepID=UPI00389A0020